MRDQDIQKTIKEFLKHTDINEDKEFLKEQWNILSENIMIVIE